MAEPVTRFVGPDLTAELRERFNPHAIAQHAHQVVVVATEGEDGFPHLAMLSHFDIVARDNHNLRVATYSDSRTTNNMRRTGKSTLAVVENGTVYYLKGQIEELRSRMTAAPYNALLNFHIESVGVDQADTDREGFARVTSGITYTHPDMPAKISRSGDLFAEMLA